MSRLTMERKMNIFLNYQVELITRNKKYTLVHSREANGKPMSDLNNKVEIMGSELLKKGLKYFVSNSYRTEMDSCYKPYWELPVLKGILESVILSDVSNRNKNFKVANVSICDLVNNTETMTTNQNLQVAQ